MEESASGSLSEAVEDVVAVRVVTARADTGDAMPERARRARHLESSLLNCEFFRRPLFFGGVVIF